jgi:LPS-assembly protein
MRRALRSSTLLLALALWAPPALAQQVSLQGYNVIVLRQEKLEDKHWLLTGAVELEQGDTKLYADQVEVFEGQDRVLARGNVVLVQGNNRIAADHADFNTKTHLGTFYRASGIASVQPPRQAPQPGGIVVPPISGQPTDVVFFGETVEKVGNKKYRITNGGFSACEQPTPRWDLSAGTVVLNVDHYTFLRQAILRVKGVPMLYVPVMYFPTKEDGRATGFLIPTYGVSTIRGQAIHNAFFWAIDRSEDATILYDWFSKTGTGGGVEYRFNRGGGSDGQISAYRLDQHEATYQVATGTTTLPAERSFTVNGNANHLFPFNLRSRARVNYFSSITSNQTFNTNINDAARNNRSYGGNVVGGWGSYSLNGTFDRNESFNTLTTTTSYINGSSPRVSLSRSERPLFPRSPIYFAISGEAAHLDHETKNDETVVDDRSLGRTDFSTQLRYPFKKWQWFTVNSSISWRDTFYTRSLDLSTNKIVDDNINRQYATLLAQTSGPIFTRVWNTPNNGYAERFKHTIEPTFSVQRTTAIAKHDRIVQNDGSDGIFGDTTSLTYGISNRLYAKRKIGVTSQAQQILSVDIGQTYYTDARASQLDPRYSTSYITNALNKFSPVVLNVRATPTAMIDATLRAEVDSRYKELRTLSAGGSYNWASRIQTSVGWSHKFFIKELTGFNDRTLLDHSLNFATSAHTTTNKYGTNYSLNYDVLHSRLLQERINAFYNAQCCGIAFEYQRYNLQGLQSFAVPADHRFFLSFTLAGLGNFSPFNGGLSGVPR